MNETFYDKFELAPGEETAGMNISRRGVPNVFLVLRPNPPARADEPIDVDKQRLGCLPFVMPHYIKEGLLARVSELVPCSSSIDEDRPVATPLGAEPLRVRARPGHWSASAFANDAWKK